MSDVRRALLAVAAASFLGGVGVGALGMTGYITLTTERDEPIDEDYVQQMRRDYDLDREQVRLLRAILRDRDSQHARTIDKVHIDDWPETARTEYEQANRELDLRIEYLLTGEQRDKWRRDRTPALK